jgi:hypothetical protein
MNAEAQNVTVLEPSRSPAVAEQNAPTTVQSEVFSAREIINKAFSNGNVDLIAKAMDFCERWDRNQARKSFDKAMSAAKADLQGKPILKNRQVDYASTRAERGNGRVQYKYEDLAGVLAVVEPALSRHGLSIGYRTEVEGTIVKVTCVIKHEDGHREENTLPGAFDASGNKNDLQKMGSTVTYLQRYTLKAALGLAASEDDDGRGAPDTGEVISKADADNIRAKINELGIPLETFLNFMKAPSIDDIPATGLKRAMHAIGQSKAAKARTAPAKPAEDLTDMPDMPANLRRAPQVVPNAREARR